MVQAMKGAQTTQLGRQIQHFGHYLKARPVKLRLARVWPSPRGEDVPPHVAGDMEGIRFDLVRPRCSGSDKVAEEIGHRLDAGGSLPERDLRPEQSIGRLGWRCVADKKPDAFRDLCERVSLQAVGL